MTGLESGPVTPTFSRMELGGDAIRKYLPDEHDSLLPALSGTSPSAAAGGMSEEDKLLFTKALMELKKEVDSLRERVNSMAGPSNSSPLIDIAGTPAASPEGRIHGNEPEWQDQEQLPQEGGITIKKAGDDLIEKALMRHNGNVKDAASELGISERTIYRRLAKIKNGA